MIQAPVSSDLKALIHDNNCLVQFFLRPLATAHHGAGGEWPYHVCDDTRQQQVLLMLVRALLRLH